MKPIIRILMLAVAMAVVLSGMVLSGTLSLAATPTLRDILPEDLKKGLTPAEAILLDKAQKGEPADFTTGNKEKDDPVNAAHWGPERTVRASLIRWLCRDKTAAGLVDAKGITIIGAKINGPVDFECVAIPFRLGLAGCSLEHVILVDASALTLVFIDSIVGGFDADRLKTSGNLIMAHVKTAGAVRLLGADIGGALVCDGAEFINIGGNSLFADGLKVNGNVFLRGGFKAVGAVRLLGADIGGSFECDGAEFNNPKGYALNANRIRVKESVYLRNGFKSYGEVNLLGADIGGNLECTGAELNNPSGYAFNAEGVKIKRNVYLSKNFKALGKVLLSDANIDGNLECIGFNVNGEVNLLGAYIGGNFKCNGAQLYNTDGKALNADGLKVTGDVCLSEGLKAKGEVRLLGADIGGILTFIGAELNNPGGKALSADGFKAKGDVFLREGFKAKGEVRFPGADIGGNLECNGADFNNPGGYALGADDVKVKGSAFLGEGFKAKGEVRLPGADIGGDLDCTRAELNNPDGKALCADNFKVKGKVFLGNGFKAKGEVRLLGADIGGNFECNGAEFNNPGGYALCADNFKVKGNVFLGNGFKAKGEVRLPSADIGGIVTLIGAEFNNPKGEALNFEGARIKGTLFLKDIKGITGGLDLLNAKAGALVDDKKSWPEKGKLYIDGFEYGGLPGNTTPNSVGERLAWLRLQPTKPFYSRSYEQLARVLREMGRESDAREILIAKQDDLRKSGELGFIDWCWNGFLGFTIGHGYKTEKALAFLVVLWLGGGLVFGWANKEGIMQCSKECGGQTFSPLMYSLDVLLPVINFHQKDYFLPDATKPYGNLVRWYFWFQIFFGWILTMLLVAFWTGLVRK